MITIELNPAIFATAPWSNLTPAQQSNFFYVIDDSTSVHTQAKWYPRPTAGGYVNALPKVSGQGASRLLAIGMAGEQVDEAFLKNVFQLNGSGGTAANNIIDGVARNVLIVKKNGTVLSTTDLFGGNY